METHNHKFPWRVVDFILLTDACKSPVIKIELIITFQCKNVYVNAPRCYVISTVPIFQWHWSWITIYYSRWKVPVRRQWRLLDEGNCVTDITRSHEKLVNVRTGRSSVLPNELKKKLRRNVGLYQLWTEDNVVWHLSTLSVWHCNWQYEMVWKTHLKKSSTQKKFLPCFHHLWKLPKAP